jgi:hypothetical protein
METAPFCTKVYLLYTLPVLSTQWKTTTGSYICSSNTESIPSHDGCRSVLKDRSFYCLKEHHGCSCYSMLKEDTEPYYFLEAEKKINWHFHNLVLSHPELEVRPIKKLPLES